jgi:hypothetical protein
MEPITRAKHLEWCKNRALRYLDVGFPRFLNKHPDLRDAITFVVFAGTAAYLVATAMLTLASCVAVGDYGHTSCPPTHFFPAPFTPPFTDYNPTPVQKLEF